MYYTINLKPNDAGLFLHIDNTSISVKSIDNNTIALWRLSDIQKRFEDKVKNLLLVKAKVKIINRLEYFLFYKAQLLSQGTVDSILRNQFKKGQISIDLRLHLKENDTVRNHGTGFRIYERNLKNIYNKVEEIKF